MTKANDPQPEIAPDLTRVINLWPALPEALREALARWPELPEPVRVGILALVGTVGRIG